MLGELGYSFYATEGTARLLEEHGLRVTPVPRISQGGAPSSDDSHIIRLIRTRKVQLVINTITGGTGKVREGIEIQDGFRIRRAAVETGIPCLTSLDTARAVVETLNDAASYEVLPFASYRG
jgi:carbamoyl-phosphate synthase large subunit